MNRRGFLRGVGAGALWLAVPSPERVRAYSFLPGVAHAWSDVEVWIGGVKMECGDPVCWRGIPAPVNGLYRVTAGWS